MAITFVKQSNDKGLLTLQGDLTIRSATEIKALLIKALVESDQVSVNFDGVSEVDVTCLQLLCSAHRSATRLNKRFLFTGVNRPDAFLALVEAAGFARSMGCSLDCGKSCLWMLNVKG